MSADLYGPMAAPNSVGIAAWHAAAEWQATPNSDKPVYYGDWWRFPLNADASPALKRRSEIKPGATQAEVQVQDGMLSHFEGWVMPKLGAAGQQIRNWHCVAQLIGPNFDGLWEGGASVSLVVRDGRWRLEQGGLQWFVDLGPYVDVKALWVEIDVVLSELDTVGTATITMANAEGGTPVMSGTMTGHATFWHQYLIWSCGIYRGSGNSAYSSTYVNSDGSVGGPQPTAYQENFWKKLGVTNSWPAVAP